MRKNRTEKVKNFSVDFFNQFWPLMSTFYIHKVFYRLLHPMSLHKIDGMVWQLVLLTVPTNFCQFIWKSIKNWLGNQLKAVD